MQTIGVRPAAITAFIFLFTVALVSPNSVRRSEWPTITNRAPVSRIMPALTSPVKAPSRSQCTFCAPTPIALPAAAPAAACSAVNGGAITTSTPRTSLSNSRNSTTYAAVSAAVLNILKLPAISGVRIGPLLQPRSPRRVHHEAREFRSSENMFVSFAILSSCPSWSHFTSCPAAPRRLAGWRHRGIPARHRRRWRCASSCPPRARR